MRFGTIALATAFALSGTLALAQDAVVKRHAKHHASSKHSGTVGMRRSTNSGNPNGTAGGPTSLSGTGSSQFGGSSPGTSGKN